jgi:hypothetical protein
MMSTPELSPLAVAVTHLKTVRLGDPRVFGVHAVLPLSWGRPQAPGSSLVDLVEARRRGWLRLHDDGSLTNHGDRGVLVLAGETVLHGARERQLGRPLLIPPGTWSPKLLAESIRGAAKVPVGGPSRRDLPEEPLPGLGAHGAAVFRGGVFEGTVLLAGGHDLQARVRSLIEESLARNPAHPAETPEADELASSLKHARRVFDCFQYVETDVQDRRGDCALVRVRTPSFYGWLVVQGGQLVYLELLPGRETPS